MQHAPARRALALAILVLPLITLAACGKDDTASSSTTTAPPSTTATTAAVADATVRTTDSPLGPVVVDAGGNTLYAFTPDTATTSACTGGCAAAWPPLVADGTPIGDGVTGALTVIDRGDGTRQVVLAGHPLYTFTGDTAPGDTNGQGSGGKWYVLSADGSLVKDASGAASTTTAAPKSRY
jgi:predicted lipoprotein with Yx(FWY)xxD motif